MAEPVDPILRELWSLGGAAGSALRVLEQPAEALEALAPELDEAEELVEAALAPLVAAPRAVGASALERALSRQEQEPAAAGAPVEEALAPARPRTRSAPRPAPDKARSIRFPELPRAVDAGALERMAAPAIEEARAPEAASKPRVEVPARRERGARLVQPAAGARAALERRADEAGAGGALHTPVSTGAAGEGRAALLSEAAKPRVAEASKAPAVANDAEPARTFARDAGAPEAPRAAAEKSGAEAKDSSGAPVRPARPVRSSVPAAPGARTEGRAQRRLSASSALAALTRRAEHAGAGRALQLPVSTEAASRERAALLTRAQEPRPSARALLGATALERAVARVAGPAADREPARVPAAAQVAPKAPAPRLEGLAGLAARAGAGAPLRRELPPPALAETAPPQPPIPAVIAERVEEAQLARRLDRILRREAEQAGVDLEGLDP